MDVTSIATTSGSTALILSIMYIAFKMIRKGTCKSMCCEKRMEVDYSLGSDSVKGEQKSFSASLV